MATPKRRKSTSAMDTAPPLASPGEVLTKRTEMGLSQKALGELLGVSDFSVWRWEDGVRTITLAHTNALRSLFSEFERNGRKLPVRAVKPD